MATFTTRLGLRKPAGTDNINVSTDIDADYDLIDANVGTTVCTSSTRPSSPFSGQTIFETDTKRFLVWTGTQWLHHSIPVVTATSQIVAPFDGQIIFNNTDDLIYRYNGSAWVGVVATGDTLHECRYYQNTGQSIPNAADTVITYETTAYTTADVTKGASHDTFTINRAGLWAISVGFRIGSGTSGERYIFSCLNGTAIGNRLAGESAETGLTCALSASCEARLAVNDVIRGVFFQSSTAARTGSVSGQASFISLAWLRP
jgi:hypothetical protein